jgi:nucleotide-binding universal stress UspA family protein
VKTFQKILIPVIGTKADEQVIKLACRLGKKDKAKIWAVYVVTVRRTLPLDADIEVEVKKAESILENMEIVAEEEEYEIEGVLVQAREVGPAIVDEAVEREADLILMGLPYKRHFGQFSQGTVVPYVLTNAPCRILIFREKI